jgi:hypothetical protein
MPECIWACDFLIPGGIASGSGKNKITWSYFWQLGNDTRILPAVLLQLTTSNMPEPLTDIP